MEQPMFVTGENYSRCVEGMLSRSKSTDIAVAFLGAGAENLLFKAVSGRIICNLESGATNPSVVRALLANHSFTVKSLSTLHAKVILTDSCVLSGSANISANGLGLESTEVALWQEAGILSNDFSLIESARSWFTTLWNMSVDIEDKDLALAELRWKHRRLARPSSFRSQKGGGLFAQIIENEDFVLDRPIYLAAWREQASIEADNSFNRWKKDQSLEDVALDFYENWSELPNDAYLVDIFCGVKGAISSTGLYWTGPEKIMKGFNYRGAGKGTIRVVFRQKTYDGLRVVRKELDDFVKIIAPQIRQLFREKDDVGDDASLCLPLHSLMMELGRQ